jgi:AcrR family transcriptional regulator
MSGKDSYHHGDLRRALLEEAGRILETEGEDAITLRRLARTLDVSHAAPGHHFRDRRALVAELAADGFRDLSDGITATTDGAPAGDWLRLGGSAYVRYGIEHPARYRLMFTSELLVSDDCPARLRDESSRAYGLLLKASYGDDQAAAIAADPWSYRIGSRELHA